MTEISTSKNNSQRVGSCNGCNDYHTPNGVDNHAVTEVTLRGMSFRLCDKCRKLLAELLARDL